ncbi:hypothetical protein B0H10DRAFT_2089476 [Mycena sp. CBHHK59/15]|nr:hypothetical protein B0H10DRAFT_2089476 [Mycena sp. CBHHK59/15]
MLGDFMWPSMPDVQHFGFGQAVDVGSGSCSVAATLTSSCIPFSQNDDGLNDSTAEMNSSPAEAIAAIKTDTVCTALTRSIRLGDGVDITVDVNRVEIPATSFAANIERLNQMWDDTSPHWKNDSVLKIDEHAIALIYWPQIFKNSELWPGMKSNWNEWKFLVDRFRQGSAEAFSAAFKAKDGSKMTYTAICDCLRKERKNEDKILAARARQEYGDSFDAKFSYRSSRSGGRIVMTKDTAIAKDYKRLNDL